MSKNINAGYLFPVFILLLSSILILIALPRVRASFNHLEISSTLKEIHKQKNIDEKKLVLAVEKIKQSLALHNMPQYWADLNTLKFYQAKRKGLLALASRDLLKNADYSLRKALGYSPANSLLWFKLSRLDFLQNSVSDETIKILTLSIMAGPNELGYLFLRLDLSMQAFEKFNETDKSWLRLQVLIAWNKYPKLFLQKIAVKNKNMDKIKELLQDSYPYIVNDMVTALENLS